MFIALAGFAQFYDGTHVDFGKNRVQYTDFEWQFFRFEDYEVYFYKGGQNLAKYTSKYVHKRIPELEKKLDYFLDERIQIIIYNKQSHFQQSNIGLSTDEIYNIGGVTQIVGSKLFIYFEGDYAKFNEQIDKGISKVLIYQMMYGGNWRQVLKNSTLLKLPDWYIEGFLSYISSPDDPYVQSRIKDGIESGLFDRFNRLQDEEAMIAGHAMWNYIADTYGENVFSNILYMTRITRDIDDGFLFVIGVDFKQFTEDWLAYYKNMYRMDNRQTNTSGTQLDIKVKKNRVYQNLVPNPSENMVAYSSNIDGQVRIFLYDIESGKRTKIYKKGHRLSRITDYSYPILDWHPSGKALSFIMEIKGEPSLCTYFLEDKEMSIQPLFGMEKVLSIDYSDDGRQMVFSAMIDGQSDLYLYNMVGNTQEKITDDFYDDLDAVFINNSTQISFVSNRSLESELTLESANQIPEEKDVFVYDLQSKEIINVSKTPKISEAKPMEIDGKLSYLAPKDLLMSRYVAEFDSSISHIDTSIHYNYFYHSTLRDTYDRSILEQNSNSNNNSFTEILYNDRKYRLLLNDNSSVYPSKTEMQGTTPQINLEDEGVIQLKGFSTKNEESRIDFSNYQFYGSQSKKEIAKKEPESESEEVALKFPTQRIYRLNFKPDNTVLQLNNTYLNDIYQNFNGGPYINAGFGAVARIGIVDLMEDYRIYGGFRYSGDLLEYSVSFQDLSKRLDKEYSFYRTRQRIFGVANPLDVKRLKGNYGLRYAISEVTSLRGGISLSNDKIIPLSTDLSSLRDQDIYNELWTSIKLAYVFDNTRMVALNIRHGMRFKIFGEHFRKIATSVTDETTGNLSVVGFDFRHYQKISREFIWVNRFAGSASFGSNKLIYYLGGVDDWFKTDIFNYETDIDYSQNYRYQALAANMRGFLQNIRNGTSFAVINSELRLPIFSYFIQRPIKSDFVRNFQVVGFGDLGTAWVGSNPYSDENTSNHRVITTGPITVRLEDVNDPLVGGLGFGLRTTILGYFVRADWAWGIQNGEVNDESIFYLSLSLDI